MTDHHVYIWDAGWKAFEDSRCYFRKYGCENEADTVLKATAEGITKTRDVGENGNYAEVDADVSFEVSDIPETGFELDDKVQILQPITGGDDDWQNCRIHDKKVEGGLITYALEVIYGQA